MSNKNEKTTKGNSGGMNSPQKPRKARVQNNKQQQQQAPRRQRGNRNEDSIPVAISRNVRSNNPLINGSEKFVVTHREYISTITTPNETGFKLVKRLRINPGSAETFSWLARTAPNWDFYKFRRICLVYEPRIGTQNAGSLIMSPDYDAAEGTVGPTEQGLFNNTGTSDDAIWKPRRIHLRSDLMNKLYKSHVNMSDSRFAETKQDIKTVDCAQVFICTDSDLKNTKIGKLLVEYEVEFFAPQFPTEMPQFGGFSTKSQPTGGLPNPLPLASAAARTAVPIRDEEQPILTNNYSSEVGAQTYPSGTLAQFTRAYQGVLDLNLHGTGISGVLEAFLAPKENLNLPTASAGEILLEALANFPLTGSSSFQKQSLKVDAKAGDLLKILTPTSVTLTDLFTKAGGRDFVSIL